MPLIKRHFIRNMDDQGYLDTFFISALTTILLIRLYLFVTGFPQVGGKGLHIAHMLWGGFAMVIGLVILISFLDHRAHRVASFFGGIGFGLFVDELGKFITSNNNYFFRPAVSIIYVLFVGMYLIFRYLQQERNVSEREYLVNSIETFKEAILHGFDRRRVEKARYYLARVPGGDDTIEAFRHTVATCPIRDPEKLTPLDRLRIRLERRYLTLLKQRWFDRTVIGLFLLSAGLTVVSAFFATLSVAGFTVPGTLTFGQITREFAREGDFIFSTIAALLEVAGAMVLFRDRFRAYQLFRIGILVDILLTDAFVFYDVQFWALLTLALNLLTLAVIDTLLSQEKARRRRGSQSDHHASTPVVRQTEVASPSG
jgi:hypothetical protein